LSCGLGGCSNWHLEALNRKGFDADNDDDEETEAAKILVWNSGKPLLPDSAWPQDLKADIEEMYFGRPAHLPAKGCKLKGSGNRYHVNTLQNPPIYSHIYEGRGGGAC